VCGVGTYSAGEFFGLGSVNGWKKDRRWQLGKALIQF